MILFITGEVTFKTEMRSTQKTSHRRCCALIKYHTRSLYTKILILADIFSRQYW